MKKSVLLSSFAIALIATGCASTSTESKTMSSSEKSTIVTESPSDTGSEMAKDEKKSKKKVKGLAQSFSTTPEAAKAATIAAMEKNGFKFKSTEGMSLEAKRSNKVGLMVGSGGEKMTAKIKPMDDGMVKVHVRTKKTLVGIAGQKNWDDEVMAMIAESLK